VILRTLDYVSFMITSFLAGLLQVRPDVVVATSPQFFTTVSGWALAKVYRVPFVFELRDLWPASIVAVSAMRENVVLRWCERLELFLYHASAKVVALTEEFRRDLLARGIPAEKVEVVTNGVDQTRYSPRPPDADLTTQLGLEGCFVVGYLGTHGMAHALDNVLEAAEFLRDAPAIRFLFVGAGATRAALIKEATKRRLDNVIFVPAQPKERLLAYWSICDLALVSLKNAPLFTTVIPSKIFEAMGMGCPILLVAPDGEASQIVRGTDAGVVVPPECPDVLASAVRTLCHDKVVLKLLAMHSLRAAPQFSREKQARDMLNILREVITTPRSFWGVVPSR
jgi:colanic acid biosynthesis glycosyl transferase WcaI